MGLGGVIFPPLLALGIDNLGWQATAVYCGIFIMAVGIPLSRVVRFKPEPYGYLPDGDKPVPETPEVETTVEPTTEPQPSAEFEYTAREALKTWPFWLIAIGHGLSLMVISVVSIHQVPYLEDELGFTRASAAMVVMVMTGVSMFGQLIGGYIGDRYSKKYIAAATLAGHVVALGLLGIADALPLVLVAAVIQGTAWGFRTPVLIAMRGDYFGRESFAMIMGFSQAVMMIGMIVGPLLSGYFADNYSYSTGFKICAALVIPGIFMFLLLRKPKPKPVRD
jgi:MFS family permease